MAVDTAPGLDERVATALERLDATIEALTEAGRSQPNGTAFVRHPKEARHDAIGFLRAAGCERIIHRYAGLSKLNPPLDPFRQGSKADDVIRCEQGITSGKANTNQIRCSVVHEGNFGTTEVTILTGSNVTPFAPWHEETVERALSLLRTAWSVLTTLRDDGPGTDEFMADVVCQAVSLMDHAGGDLPAGSRMGIDVAALSPVSRAYILPNWQRSTFDPNKADIRPLVLPPAVGLSLWMQGSETRISIHPAVRGVRFAEIDAMARLRATARISERGYRRSR